MSDDARLDNERGIVRVRMTRELVDQFWMRTADGRRVTVEWGEADSEGFHEPVFTATPDGFGDLDAAWAEAEAALPEGWAINILWGTVTEDRWAAGAGPFPAKAGDAYTGDYAGGSTPAAALRALAAKMRETK